MHEISAQALRVGRPLVLLVVGVAVLALPFLLRSNVFIGAMVTIAIFSVMVYGLDVMFSYLGEVSLGHTVFWGLGGYVTAMIAANLEWSSWATLALSVGAAAVVALLIGLLTLRTRGFVFSLVTYSVAVIALAVAGNWSFVGGSDGITRIPYLDLSIGGWTITPRTNLDIWPYAFGLLVIAVYLVWRFRRSRIGMQSLMLHTNPDLASAIGVNQRIVRLGVFVLSACITAAAGWLYAYQRAFVGPDLFGSYFLVLMLAAIVIGGERVLVGPVIGVAVITLQQTYFSLGGYGDFIILGALLAVILLIRKSPLPGYVAQRWRRRRTSLPTVRSEHGIDAA